MTSDSTGPAADVPSEGAIGETARPMFEGHGVIELVGPGAERAEWAREFIYGAMTVVIVLAGISSIVTDQIDDVRAAAIVFVGAGATWAAHSFSEIIGLRLAGVATDGRHLVEAMRHAWPILAAAVPATVVMLLAELGVWPSEFAIDLGYVISILILAGAGVMAGRATGVGNARAVLWGLASGAVGAAIVAVELWLTH